eukprot:355589-Chlamydomonas_euryale.AAC.2
MDAAAARAAEAPHLYQHLLPKRRGERGGAGATPAMHQAGPSAVTRPEHNSAGSGGDGDGSGEGISGDEDSDDGGGVDLGALAMLPSDLTTLDAEVLSTLPQSLQLEILEKMRDAQFAGREDAGREDARRAVCR